MAVPNTHYTYNLYILSLVAFSRPWTWINLQALISSTFARPLEI